MKCRSLVFPKGVWRCHVIEFQYDMTLDVSVPYKNVRKEFLKIAHEAYDKYDECKKEYLKWLLKIQ